MPSTEMTKGHNGEIQEILTDILIGLKAKFIQPVLDENTRLLQTLEEIKKHDRASLEELNERVAKLEQKVEEIPVLVLTAIRDAINQAAGGV